MVVISLCEDVLVVLVEIDALLDDGLVVAVERHAARLVSARALEVAGLDFEHVVLAVTVGVDPSADRIAGEVVGSSSVGPIAPVGVDAARL